MGTTVPNSCTRQNLTPSTAAHVDNFSSARPRPCGVSAAPACPLSAACCGEITVTTVCVVDAVAVEVAGDAGRDEAEEFEVVGVGAVEDARS